MTAEIAGALGILLVALVLLVGGWLRADLVALLVLAVLALSGLATPAEALSGFANPAVVTVWSVFILGGGLSRTGVAGAIGRQVVRVAGRGEVRLLLAIMVTSAFTSAFMSTVGVVALFLPVVMDIARTLGMPPARLLIPLSYSAFLGGLTTLIGTPSNILIADALRGRGLPPFRLLDFAPVGLCVAAAGILFVILLGRRLLPTRDAAREARAETSTAERLEELYRLRERLFTLRVRAGSALDGKPLAESRLGAALGLAVVAVMRNGEMRLAPQPNLVLRAGDSLLVQGDPGRLSELQSRGQLLVPEEDITVERLRSTPVDVAEARLSPEAAPVGRTLKDVDFRVRYGLTVLAAFRQGRPLGDDLHDTVLEAGDRLLVQGSRDLLEAIGREPGFDVSEPERAELARLRERLFAVGIPAGSALADHSLAESRLGDAFGLTCLSIIRDGRVHPGPEPDEPLEAGDILLVEGDAEDLRTIRALQELEIERRAPALEGLEGLEAPGVGLMETVLSPHSRLAGKTLRELHFREKYGLTVLAIMREGRTHRSDLRDMPLRLGDALLLYGPAERLAVLGGEPDFIVLTRTAQRAPRRHKAPVALLIMAAVLAPVVLGLLPVAIATLSGAALMVLTGCLSMEEAYDDIEWQAVFLIAGLLPLGLALDATGAAAWLAEAALVPFHAAGPHGLLAGLFLFTALGAQVIHPAALAVLVSPIAFSSAAALGVSPYPVLMTVAMAAGSCFASPISHPANWLVVGPGGYRPVDFVRTGLPLLVLVFLVTILVTPLVWPLTP